MFGRKLERFSEFPYRVAHKDADYMKISDDPDHQSDLYGRLRKLKVLAQRRKDQRSRPLRVTQLTPDTPLSPGEKIVNTIEHEYGIRVNDLFATFAIAHSQTPGSYDLDLISTFIRRYVTGETNRWDSFGGLHVSNNPEKDVPFRKESGKKPGDVHVDQSREPSQDVRDFCYQFFNSEDGPLCLEAQYWWNNLERWAASRAVSIYSFHRNNRDMMEATRYIKDFMIRFFDKARPIIDKYQSSRLVSAHDFTSWDLIEYFNQDILLLNDWYHEFDKQYKHQIIFLEEKNDPDYGDDVEIKQAEVTGPVKVYLNPKMYKLAQEGKIHHSFGAYCVGYMIFQLKESGLFHYLKHGNANPDVNGFDESLYSPNPYDRLQRRKGKDWGEVYCNWRAMNDDIKFEEALTAAKFHQYPIIPDRNPHKIRYTLNDGTVTYQTREMMQHLLQERDDTIEFDKWGDLPLVERMFLEPWRIAALEQQIVPYSLFKDGKVLEKLIKEKAERESIEMNFEDE